MLLGKLEIISRVELFTAVIILAWTPKMCLEYLLCCNQSQARSSHRKIGNQETTGNERFPIGHGTNYFRFV